MKDSNSIFFFDKLEKKFVFKISRSFFWILTSLTFLVVIISILFLIYSLIPPAKEEIVLQPLPSAPIISQEELKSELNSIPPTDQRRSTIQKKKEVSSSQESNEPYSKTEYDGLLDSLGTFFPSQWETKYVNKPATLDFYGNVTGYKKEFAGTGLRKRVENFLEKFSEDSLKAHIIKNAINVIAYFDVNEREKVLDNFIDKYNKKWREYKYVLDKTKSDNNARSLQAEEKYLKDQMEKNQLSENALTVLGGGIVLIAFWGLILSLLAIERNTRMMKELIEKKNENS